MGTFLCRQFLIFTTALSLKEVTVRPFFRCSNSETEKWFILRRQSSSPTQMPLSTDSRPRTQRGMGNPVPESARRGGRLPPPGVAPRGTLCDSRMFRRYSGNEIDLQPRGPKRSAPAELRPTPGWAPPPLQSVLSDGSRRPSVPLGSFRQRSRVPNVPPVVSRLPSSHPPAPFSVPSPPPPQSPRLAPPALRAGQDGGLRDLELRTPAPEAAAAGASRCVPSRSQTEGGAFKNRGSGGA